MRELLELEIKLARMRVAADYLKQRKRRQGEKASRLYWLHLAELAGSTVSGSLIGRKYSALPAKYRFGILTIWALWQLLQKKASKKR